MTKRQESRLKALFEDAFKSARLSDWERDFLLDLKKRFEKYADRTSVSDKQWDAVGRIEGKIYAAG